MNQPQHVSQGATPDRRQPNQVEAWLSKRETALRGLAKTLTAGPGPSHFDANEIYIIMARKLWIHSVCDPRFFLAGDLALLRAAWLEALTALQAGQRYALNIHVKSL